MQTRQTPAEGMLIAASKVEPGQQKDRTMGLNHQSASLSCALGEAFLTRRTLVMPARVCLFALHTERWAAAGPGERCIPIGELYDIAALSKLVPPMRACDQKGGRRASSHTPVRMSFHSTRWRVGM